MMDMDDQQNEPVNTEAIIANLTSKNLELEEQIKRLLLEINELEQLHHLDEEIIEVQKDTEREMQMKNTELLMGMTALKNRLDELESQLESQASSEEIIASLTAKNLDLEELNRQLTMENNELEELHQVDEEIIEAQKETEKDLLLKNEEQLITIAALKRQLIEWETRAVDYEKAIVKFRQKTADLNEEVQNLRDDLATMQTREEEKARSAGAEISLLANANRTFSEIVESELTGIELKFARQHISCLRSFLPDNFTKAGGDNDCLILCVLFPRLSAKALALSQLLQQKFPLAPGGLRREHVTLAHRAEQWAHVRHFGYQLQQLHTTLEKFTAVFKNCSAERLSRLAVQQMEAAQRETRLEDYFKLLQQNRFDENTSIEQLEQIVKYFQRLFSANLSTEQYNGREDLRNTLAQLKDGFGWIQFNGQRLRHFLLANSPMAAGPAGSSSASSGQNSSPSASDTLAASMHSSLMAKSMTGSHMSMGANAEFNAFLDRLGQLLTECEGLAIRALNRIPQENELMLTPELNERLLSTVAALEKCGRIVQQSCSLATSQLSAVDSDGLPAQQMLEFVLSSVEKFVGQMDGHRRAHAQIFESLESIKSVLDGLSEALENSSMEIPPNPKCQANGFPPLFDRAHSRKQDAVEAEGLRWQVTKKDEELVKLQRALKAKEQDISTMKLRLDMADKQVADNTTGATLNAQIKQLQIKCDQLQEELQHEKSDSEQRLADLKAQVATLELELKKEQARTRQFSTKALIANMTPHRQLQTSIRTSASSSSPVAGGGGGIPPDMLSGDGDVGTSKGVEMQQLLDELKAAQDKIRTLEGQQPSSNGKSQVSINGQIPSSACPVCVEREDGEQRELQEMTQESEALMRDSNLLLKPTDPRQWGKYLRSVENINFRAESLRIRFHRHWHKYRRAQPMPTRLWPIPAEIIATENADESADDPEAVLERWDALLKEQEANLLGAVKSSA